MFWASELQECGRSTVKTWRFN